MLRRTLGVGGAVGVGAGSSMFVGMVEAPLVIRAYLKNLSRSEFFIVLTAGMSTVAGSIMVLYANVLRGRHRWRTRPHPDRLGHQRDRRDRDRAHDDSVFWSRPKAATSPMRSSTAA